MNDMQEIRDQLARIEAKTEAAFQSAEKMRKYFKWTLIITVATIVLPMIGLAFVIPFYMSTLTGGGLDTLNSLGGSGLGL